MGTLFQVLRGRKFLDVEQNCNSQNYDFSLFSCSRDWNGFFLFSLFCLCNLFGSIKWAFLLFSGRESIDFFPFSVNQNFCECVCNGARHIPKSLIRRGGNVSRMAKWRNEKSSFDRKLIDLWFSLFPSAKSFIFKFLQRHSSFDLLLWVRLVDRRTMQGPVQLHGTAARPAAADDMQRMLCKDGATCEIA